MEKIKIKVEESAAQSAKALAEILAKYTPEEKQEQVPEETPEQIQIRELTEDNTKLVQVVRELTDRLQIVKQEPEQSNRDEQDEPDEDEQGEQVEGEQEQPKPAEQAQPEQSAVIPDLQKMFRNLYDTFKALTEKLPNETNWFSKSNRQRSAELAIEFDKFAELVPKFAQKFPEVAKENPDFTKEDAKFTEHHPQRIYQFTIDIIGLIDNLDVNTDELEDVLENVEEITGLIGQLFDLMALVLVVEKNNNVSRDTIFWNWMFGFAKYGAWTFFKKPSLKNCSESISFSE